MFARVRPRFSLLEAYRQSITRSRQVFDEASKSPSRNVDNSAHQPSVADLTHHSYHRLLCLSQARVFKPRVNNRQPKVQTAGIRVVRPWHRLPAERSTIAFVSTRPAPPPPLTHWLPSSRPLFLLGCIPDHTSSLWIHGRRRLLHQDHRPFFLDSLLTTAAPKTLTAAFRDTNILTL